MRFAALCHKAILDNAIPFFFDGGSSFCFETFVRQIESKEQLSLSDIINDEISVRVLVPLAAINNLLAIKQHDFLRVLKEFGVRIFGRRPLTFVAELNCYNCEVLYLLPLMSKEASEKEFRYHVEKSIRKYLFVSMRQEEVQVSAKGILAAPIVAACLSLKDANYLTQFEALFQHFDVALSFPMVAHSNKIYAYYHSLRVAIEPIVSEIFRDSRLYFLSARTLSSLNIASMMKSAVQKVIDYFQLDLLQFIYSCGYNYPLGAIL